MSVDLDELERLHAKTSPLTPEDVDFLIGIRNCLPALIAELRAYRDEHKSDCAVHNEPAYPTGECDCKPNSGMIVPNPVTEPK